MTAQIAERLRDRGQDLALCTEPLGQYFELGGVKPEFGVRMTALWRGYVGRWEIVGERLYLVGLGAHGKDGREMSLADVFPGHPERVFAHWYCGTLRVPEGRLLEYVHGGYLSRYERDRLIDVERGLVVGRHVRHNGQSTDPRAPDGYGIGAYTTFSAPKPQQEKKP